MVSKLLNSDNKGSKFIDDTENDLTEFFKHLKEIGVKHER